MALGPDAHCAGTLAIIFMLALEAFTPMTCFLHVL